MVGGKRGRRKREKLAGIHAVMGFYAVSVQLSAGIFSFVVGFTSLVLIASGLFCWAVATMSFFFVLNWLHGWLLVGDVVCLQMYLFRSSIITLAMLKYDALWYILADFEAVFFSELVCGTPSFDRRARLRVVGQPVRRRPSGDIGWRISRRCGAVLHGFLGGLRRLNMR